MPTTHAHQAPVAESPARTAARQPAPRQPAPAGPGAADGTRLVVQRSLGNDYLQRTADCGSGDDSARDTGSGCSGCGGCALSRMVQTKLRVTAAGDAYEQEADRVAERVVGMSVQAGGRDPAQGVPRVDIQRLPAAPAGAGEWSGSQAGSVDLTLPTGGGRPLSATTRSFMEPRFGRAFADVRVHTGPDADRAASRIRARAFTHGQDVYLRAGESEHDHRLMAHELTHVIQQSGGASPTRPVPGAPTAGAPTAGAPTAGAAVADAPVQRAISPELDQIEDLLSYGVFDWAITDAEALRALALLKTLPRFQQATFFANAKYAGRLRDNLPDARVAELDAIARDVASLQAPQDTVTQIRDRLSYGLFDWAVTDRDATEALDMLEKLSGPQLATALAAINYPRLMDNLPEARRQELADLYDRALGLGGTRQTEEESHPGTVIRSISFRSDHNVMKDNTRSWANSGRLYGEPEWFASRGEVVSYPISQTRNTDVSISLGLNVLPLTAPSAPVRLTGRSPEAALNFDYSGTMAGGMGQYLSLTSTGKLPDTIVGLRDRQIAWTLEWQGWTHEIARTNHTIFVTNALPIDPADVTEKRMRTAVDLVGQVVGRIGTLDPHSVVRGVMRRWGAYNLGVQLGGQPGDEWKLADDLDTGAQCIDIVRFVNALMRTVGIPGTSTAIVVWARPEDPDTPIPSVYPHGGLHGYHTHPSHPDWQAALMDANGCGNNFEAALQFEHGGTLRYYPGGVSMNREYLTPLDVLHVFQCLAWLSFTGGQVRIEEIAKTYPGGHCETGPVTCHM
ncbi:eCIS core domain-containing protein [Rugosimonospora africana]|uniref:eCIS core domain-containing protein n=1 Tax=Rugosimonospora africana TaxID=556532 RepID=A0A8J3QR53_9ACTN|nr:DUF4157 domain-containing protein [Rugosimonospora africana]GIH14150.1 hypothetical protein Raf01_23220 [Rugosimonospora africana]